MRWEAVREVYSGLSLDPSSVQKHKTRIDEIVEDRNQAAHHGVLPKTAAGQMEQHVRANVAVVEDVLEDFALRILPYFSSRMHLR